MLSLSPPRLDHNDNRRPRNIFMAKCLCQGCIIDQRESYNYNSVEVTIKMKVLYIHPCTTHPGKHMVIHQLLPVSVACTCALPKYAAWSPELLYFSSVLIFLVSSLLYFWKKANKELIVCLLLSLELVPFKSHQCKFPQISVGISDLQPCLQQWDFKVRSANSSQYIYFYFVFVDS